MLENDAQPATGANKKKTNALFDYSDQDFFLFFRFF